MTYAKRTCTKCGFRDIQPNMKQIEVEYESGSSQAGLSTRAVVGTIFGSEGSAKQVNNWISGNTKRQYKRKRNIWVCSNGCKKVSEKKHTIIGDGDGDSFDYSDNGRLSHQINHIDNMMGVLESGFFELRDTKSQIASIRSINDIQARDFTKKIDSIELLLKKEIILLGRIYSKSNERYFVKIAKSIFYIANGILCCIGLWFIISSYMAK